MQFIYILNQINIHHGFVLSEILGARIDFIME